MELEILSRNTKTFEVRMSAKTQKAFKKYLKNLIVSDYEKDNLDETIIIESWLASFAESEEYKRVEREANEAKEQEQKEKEMRKIAQEEKKQKKIADLEAQIKKLKGEI